MSLFRIYHTLEKPEVGQLLVGANRFTHKVVEAQFRPAGTDKVYLVAPLSAAMDIINAADRDEALATLDYWRKGLPD